MVLSANNLKTTAEWFSTKIALLKNCSAVYLFSALQFCRKMSFRIFQLVSNDLVARCFVEHFPVAVSEV